LHLDVLRKGQNACNVPLEFALELKTGKPDLINGLRTSSETVVIDIGGDA